MNSKIEEYFFPITKELSYIEIKDNKEHYKDLGLEGLSLPVITDELLKGITNNKLNQEVDLSYIIDGMLYNIAADYNFRYVTKYIKVLNNLLESPSNYAINKGVSILEKDEEKSLVYFRAAYFLEPINSYAAYNYARLLWRVKGDEEEFVRKSIEILENIISRDEKFPLSYYELGIINRHLGNFMKALSFYKKSLYLVDQDIVKAEIRNEISQIEPDALVEDAIYHINKMDYSRAIDRLNEAKKNSSRYDIPYYLGVSYMNMGYLELAEESFEDALLKGADFSTIYIDIIYVKYALGKTVDALHISNDALNKYPSDIKIRYNRAMIYIDLDKKDKAIEDFDFILEYADLSDELFNQIMIIKTELLS